MSREAPESASMPLELVAYQVSHVTVPLRVADRHRDWMDQTPDRYAYRCLPLVIANQAGWELLCPTDAEVSWNGGTGKEAITVKADGPTEVLISSHFGSGILTFSLGYLFQTPPGYNLWCKGPVNLPKDGIAPLEGIIETDWTPYTFTMNWKFTRPGTIRFAKDEPFAHLVPQRRGELAAFRPRVRNIHADPELFRHYNAWRESRSQFITDLRTPESAARAQKWQRAYMLGEDADQKAFPDHETKLKVLPFRPD